MSDEKELKRELCNAKERIKSLNLKLTRRDENLAALKSVMINIIKACANRDSKMLKNWVEIGKMHLYGHGKVKMPTYYNNNTENEY